MIPLFEASIPIPILMFIYFAKVCLFIGLVTLFIGLLYGYKTNNYKNQVVQFAVGKVIFPFIAAIFIYLAYAIVCVTAPTP